MDRCVWRTALVTLGLTLGFATAQPAPSAEGGGQLDLDPGFPRTLFHRHERWLSESPPEETVSEMGRYDAVSLKLFDEAPRRQNRPLRPLVVALKQKRPTIPVLVHLDHYSHVRPGEGERLSRGRREFTPRDPRGVAPGHWLYYPGSSTTAPIDESSTVIPVAATDEFGVGDDVRLWPPGARDRPALWAESEVVFVTGVDPTQGTLQVQRGMCQTHARSFPKGAAATPHVKHKYAYPGWRWVYNLASVCPLDEEGRPFTVWYADWIAAGLQEINESAGFRVVDGVEFDVTRFNLSVGPGLGEGQAADRGSRRAPDCDLDGTSDGGYIDGWPVYGFGTIECMKRLRERLGPDYLITGDSLHVLWRPWTYANGMGNESFPDIGNAYRWSGAFERAVDWQQHAVEPHFSFLMTRAEADRLPGQKDAYQTLRLSLGAALMVDSWHCTSQLPGGNSRRPDEYDGGALGRPHWLGRPLGDVVRVPQYVGADRMGYGAFNADKQIARAKLVAGPDYGVRGPLLDRKQAHKGKGSLRVEVNRLPDDSTKIHAWSVRLRLPVTVTPGTEYTVDFWARAEHQYAERSPACAGVPWGTWVSLFAGEGRRESKGQHCLLVPAEWRHYHISIVAGPKGQTAGVDFEIGGEPGTLWLDDVQMYQGGADVFWRRFENGLVLVNGSRQPVSFDLGTIEPDRALTRLTATQIEGEWQSDRSVNDGRPVPSIAPCVVPAFDALFLLAAGQG